MADINVLMVGGRRAGKTSLLAAVKACCDEKQLEKLNVAPILGGDMMNAKIEEMEGYFTKPEYVDKEIFSPDGSPNDNPAEYEFQVSVKGTHSSYTIGFTDVPGEYYGTNEFGEFTAEEFEEIQQYISDRVQNSQVFLIAIDTPHLMEMMDKATGYGAGHEWFNRVDQITEFFKTAFQDSQHRLVLFVPIKCERYLQKMDKVAACVEKGYAELIAHLTESPVSNLCTVAITPIVSLGGAKFLSFPESEEFPNGDWHNVGEYRYLENTDERKYDPKNCEQPLMLVLRYLMESAEALKDRENPVFRWFRERFGKQARIEDLLACKDEINSLIISDKKSGYVQLHPKNAGSDR